MRILSPDCEQAANEHGLARHNIQELETVFPHPNFPIILQLMQEHFPEYFDHVSGAVAQHTGPKPIS